MLKYGFVFPLLDVRKTVSLAVEAESAGWDGVFVADTAWGIDPWIILSAIAVQTHRVRLGTMITPVSRRRPWKLASETATLDNLSNGRAVLSVGLGALDSGFAEFGEVTDRKTRAELLDEGLTIVTGLWRGQPFRFDGKHYHVKPLTFFAPPPPKQSPRIPIWVVGAWPHGKSLRRAAHYDGLLPAKMNPDGSFDDVKPDDILAMTAFIREFRETKGIATPFDIVSEGRTSGTDKGEIASKIEPMIEGGITWWLESMWLAPNDESDVAKRIRQGPPRIG
ncbi:MAG TPA: LLM class flavin-dependent oxidoreductase [Aggregatilineales bacterium]|nr:LLM class flavin-dependent oxidoreductase [Aggregatilineales bacterium]